jgi:superfamily II DNA or RNA helicase
MMAVHSSNVEPLPHQITAVYESLLPRQPLRYVLADDPGAGKTIMSGLYIRELIMRADSHRILIVAPGSLVEQWRDELFEKFGLEFHVYSTLLEQTSPSGGDAGRANIRAIGRLVVGGLGRQLRALDAVAGKEASVSRYGEHL